MKYESGKMKGKNSAILEYKKTPVTVTVSIENAPMFNVYNFCRDRDRIALHNRGTEAQRKSGYAGSQAAG